MPPKVSDPDASGQVRFSPRKEAQRSPFGDGSVLTLLEGQLGRKRSRVMGQLHMETGRDNRAEVGEGGPAVRVWIWDPGLTSTAAF